MHLFAGLSLITLPILYWDSLRWHVAPSPWDLSVRNYGGFAVAPMTDWLARLAEWGELLWYFTASTSVWLVLAGLAVWMLVRAVRRRAWADGLSGAYPLLFSAWALFFVGFHVITTTQVWDRYLLPLAPIFGLLLGYGIRCAGRNRLLAVAVLLLGGLMMVPASGAARGEFPIGGDHGDYAGLAEAVTWLEENALPGGVLYHRALGWHYRFYFFDGQSPADNRFDLRWYAHSVYVADNAAKVPHRRRFLLLPEWMAMPGLERDLAVRQLTLLEHLRAGRFTLYELLGPPQEFCDWCACLGRPSPFSFGGQLEFNCSWPGATVSGR